MPGLRHPHPLPACPVCAADCQHHLDTEPANSAPAHPIRPAAPLGAHARLRRPLPHQSPPLLRHLPTPPRHPRHLPPPPTTRPTTEPGIVRAADHHDEETTLIVGILTFAGAGWHTTGDALLANTAADLARARHAPAAKNSPTKLGSTHVPRTLQAA